MTDKVGLFLQSWRVKTILPHIKGDFLDVGCGTNQLCAQYKKIAPSCNTVGLDVYPWKGVDMLVENVSKLPFADASFDTVACIAALNHIPERENFLKEVGRVLKPQGIFIVTMLPPFISRVWHFIRSPWDPDQHERGMSEGEVYGFTTQQIEAMLAKHLLCLIKHTRFMLGINSLYIAQTAYPSNSQARNNKCQLQDTSKSSQL